jgi:DNA-binding NtrC family response regulator
LENAKTVNLFNFYEHITAPNDRKRIGNLIKAMIKHIMGMDFEWFTFPDNPADYFSQIRDIIIESQKETQKNVNEKKDDREKDIFDMNEEELLRYYYRGMLERSGYNETKAAEKIGKHKNTFRSRMEKLGMK